MATVLVTEEANDWKKTSEDSTGYNSYKIVNSALLVIDFASTLEE